MTAPSWTPGVPPRDPSTAAPFSRPAVGFSTPVSSAAGLAGGALSAALSVRGGRGGDGLPGVRPTPAPVPVLQPSTVGSVVGGHGVGAVMTAVATPGCFAPVAAPASASLVVATPFWRVQRPDDALRTARADGFGTGPRAGPASSAFRTLLRTNVRAAASTMKPSARAASFVALSPAAQMAWRRHVGGGIHDEGVGGAAAGALQVVPPASLLHVVRMLVCGPLLPDCPPIAAAGLLPCLCRLCYHTFMPVCVVPVCARACVSVLSHPRQPPSPWMPRAVKWLQAPFPRVCRFLVTVSQAVPQVQPRSLAACRSGPPSVSTPPLGPRT